MDYITKVSNQRERFLKYNEVPKNLRKDILNSWIRCKKYAIGKNNSNILPKSEFENILNQKSEFIQICLPVMLNLYEILKDTDYCIILTDENGVILKIIGNEKIMSKNRELGFLEGRRWREEDVGTNAIGTCLYLDKPIYTLGAEQYCRVQDEWTCSAAPIHDSKGNIIGCIDLSGSCESFQEHTLAIAIEASNTITKQFTIMENKKWTEATFNSMNNGILVLDNEFKIKDFNEKFCKTLGISSKDVYKLDMKVVLKDILKDMYNKGNENKIRYRKVRLDIERRSVECNISLNMVEVNGNYIGYLARIKKAEATVVNKTAAFSSKYTFDDIITSDNKMLSMINDAKKIAKSECSVLITGESGTGKELFAHSIHNASKRSNGPFVVINCAAIPKDLVESELFGYERGSFTGASKEGNPGKFELANGGTIFLDEIGELPLEIQPKLLRVLDNHKVARIGGKYERNLDVRFIAATNRNLLKEVDNNNFRSDLYFRLSVFTLELVPLRDRKEDILEIVELFLRNLSKKNKNYGAAHVSRKFLDIIKNYSWPGNIRELENVIERAYYLSSDGNIDETLIPDYIMENQGVEEDDKISSKKISTMEEVEKAAIIKALEQYEGNVVNACKLLQLSKSTLYRKIKKYKLNSILLKYK